MTIFGRSLFVVAIAVSAAAAARAQNAPQRPATPARDSVPVLRPPTTPPPSSVRPRATQQAVRVTSAVAQLRAPGRASAVPPDSVRPASAAPSAAPPANAVARCGDGTFVVAPGDAGACSTHGGLKVMLPRSAAPRRRAAVTAQAALRAAPAPESNPPDGATMRCKDGTYLIGAPAEGRCDGNGGLLAILPAPRATPPPPPRQRRP